MKKVEDGIEAGIAVTDDLFLMEGVGSNSSQLRSPQSVVSDEDRDDSELDEGIHIPSKFGKKKSYEVNRQIHINSKNYYFNVVSTATLLNLILF